MPTEGLKLLSVTDKCLGVIGTELKGLESEMLNDILTIYCSNGSELSMMMMGKTIS